MSAVRIYQHPKRPEWGMAVMHEWVGDRVRFAFEDAQVRTFFADILDVLEVVTLPEAEALALQTKLQSKRKNSTATAARSKTPRPRRPAATGS